MKYKIQHYTYEMRTIILLKRAKYGLFLFSLQKRWSQPHTMDYTINVLFFMKRRPKDTRLTKENFNKYFRYN